MSATEESLALLKSIDASLKELVSIAKKRKPAGGKSDAPDVEPAGDDDLDGNYGNPKVKFKPRDWNDGDYKGHLFSECPPPFLDSYAKSLLYFASQNDKKGEEKKAFYDRKDAARAMGWARRIRAGWRPAAPSAGAMGGNYDFDDSNEAEAEVHHSQFDEF